MTDEAMNIDLPQQPQYSPPQQEENSHDSQITLHTLPLGPLSSSLRKLSTSSHTLPSNRDFHFFNNFDSFKFPVQELSAKSQSLLQSIGSSSNELFKGDLEFPADLDIDDACDWLVNVNDEIFEQFNASIDEFQRARNEGDAGGGDGFQVVSGKKKKKVNSVVKVAEKKAKVPFHISTIRRPQEEFNILANNSNQPFEHVWLEKSEDGLRFVHPLEKVSALVFVDEITGSVEPVPPPPLESTPYKLVEEVKDLKELATKLRSVNEFAVDLEHNQYRSFQGLTCLMQISTRTEDFVVDTLKLRIHVGPYLRDVFKDPTKKKVMHGADRDIIWLQKDFGIYVCNMFDTGQASRVLKLERNSLEYLLLHFCGVTANKEYQNADWRLRPIPDVMLRYAREDTHYLLYIYDLMKNKLISMPSDTGNSDSPLVEVYKRSYDICMQLYEKELLTENSYLHIYGLLTAGFNAQQLAIVAGLFEWRDVIARTEDESTGYILPNRTLLEIAKHKPVTASQLRRVLKSKHPYVERNLESVVSIIRHSMQNSSAFEAAVQHIKDRQREMALKGNSEANDGCEASTSGSPTKLENNGGDALDSSGRATSPTLSKGLEHASNKATITNIGKGVSFKHQSENGNVRFSSSNQAEPRESLFVSQHRGDTNIRDISSLAEAPGAMVQVQRKPNKGFGALLGRPTAKKRPDVYKNDKEDSKLEKIRSSVNLPFHSFLGRPEPPKPVVEEPTKVPEIQKPEEPTTTTATDSSSKEIIVLDDELDSDDSEPTRDDETKVPDIPRTEEPSPATGSGLEDIIILDDELDDDDVDNIRSDGKSKGSSPEVNQEDESVALSNLSTSFEKCFQSINQNKKPTSRKSREPSGLVQFKPFNFAAAIGMVKFGKDRADESEAQIERNDSAGRRKNAATDRAKKDDGTRQFLPARRRQAFPASGNRSATFR